MAGKTVVVLGGGVGGLVAANRLRRLLKRDHRVVLVDRSSVHTFPPSYPWVMLGQRTGAAISRSLRRLEKKGIELVTGEITGLDLEGRKVALSNGELEYDYLVISLGAEYSSDEIEGLNRTWTFYHLDGAEGLQEKLPTVSHGRIAVVVSSLPFKCPAAPYEGALLLDHYFRKRKIRDEVELHLYTPEPQPMRAAGDHVGQAVMEMLGERGIGFTAGAQLKAVDQRQRKMRFQDGSEAPFDLVVATPIHRVPAVIRNSPLSPEGRWVEVDRETMATAVPDVYAIGDIVDIPLESGVSLPKAGVFAHAQAEVVARNIAAEIGGEEPVWGFGGHGACYLEIGGGKAAYAVGNFYENPPDVQLRKPGRMWHWSRLGFERMWLMRWF